MLGTCDAGNHILLYLETKLSRSIAFSPLQGLTVMTGQRVVVQQQGLLTQGTAPYVTDLSNWSVSSANEFDIAQALGFPLCILMGYGE